MVVMRIRVHDNLNWLGTEKEITDDIDGVGKRHETGKGECWTIQNN